MSDPTTLLLLPILLPAAAALPALLLGRRSSASGALVVLVAAAQLLIVARLIGAGELRLDLPLAGFGIDFSLRLCSFGTLVLGGIALFGLLEAIYAAAFMRGSPRASRFHCYYLLTIACASGAALADNFVVMLFFWEGLLGTLFGMILLGPAQSPRTAIKALVINGVTDLCLMVGIGITVILGQSTSMSAISLVPEGAGALAFVLLAIGALAKAGSMPFHSWIPDAALDAPLPFMALLPAAVEKLLGIYLLARISIEIYPLRPGSALSTMLLVVGAATILLAVLMALIQRDYKRLLSFHAVSQVGYMVLGVGTAAPAGVVGGVFHMINNALYKSGLFLTAGLVEKQTGTTDLARLSGLGRRMPLTCGIFVVTAVSICGVPPFNGFFSKELVYTGALASGWPFYAAALLGSLLTAASFLKLGHAVYFGERRPEHQTLREGSLALVLPAGVIAAICVLFGVYNALPLRALVQPSLAAALPAGQDFAGFHVDWLLAGTIVVLGLALANHAFGVRRSGSALGAADHIHHAPGLRQVYDAAEARRLDPYVWFVGLADRVGQLSFWTDRGVDALVSGVAGASRGISAGVRAVHTGSHGVYLVWALLGVAASLIWVLA